MRRIVFRILFTMLLLLPVVGAAATVTLTKAGPETAREGDLVVYVLDVVNEGTAVVQGVEVIDTLPATVTFVDAITTPGGSYDPVTGI